LKALWILKDKVHLLGKVEHRQLGSCYNSADYFVAGSHREGSGYALSEALSCGCIPIVTNIPSFHMMTNEGQLGSLWNPGDKNSFANAATKAINKLREKEARACILFYKDVLSFGAIAKKALLYYQVIMERRRNK
jgi:glycosyltransferase involved in cell wall biosynthesis